MLFIIAPSTFDCTYLPEIKTGYLITFTSSQAEVITINSHSYDSSGMNDLCSGLGAFSERDIF